MSFNWDEIVKHTKKAQKPPNNCECGGAFELEQQALCHEKIINGKPIGQYDRMTFKCRKCDKTKQTKRYLPSTTSKSNPIQIIYNPPGY